jgi:hypothetical protein
LLKCQFFIYFQAFISIKRCYINVFFKNHGFNSIHHLFNHSNMVNKTKVVISEKRPTLQASVLITMNHFNVNLIIS